MREVREAHDGEESKAVAEARVRGVTAKWVRKRAAWAMREGGRGG